MHTVARLSRTALACKTPENKHRGPCSRELGNVRKDEQVLLTALDELRVWILPSSIRHARID